MGFMGCGECGVGGLTEAEALAHECGVVPSEPETAPEPATMADLVASVQMLGLVMVRMAEAQEETNRALRGFVQAYLAENVAEWHAATREQEMGL